MSRNFFAAVILGTVSMALMGCPTTPQTEEKKDALHDNAQAALREMEATDAGVRKFLDSSYGYVVFPTVGKGGLIVGGAQENTLLS